MAKGLTGSSEGVVSDAFWEAVFGLELDWEKLWRDQVFGAKVRPWEACFGPELD